MQPTLDRPVTPLPKLTLAKLAICLLTYIGATSAPVRASSLFFQYGGPQANGNQSWLVMLRPNSDSAAAVEIGFEFIGGSIISIAPNVGVFDDLNPGQNPFTGTVTQGVSIHNLHGAADAAFASVGGVVPAVADTLVLTLVTNHTGVMTLGGQNHNGFFTGARVVQNNVKTDGLTASLQVTGLEADFNADGKVNGADFLIWQRRLGLVANATRADGDANADGAVNAADLSIWRGQFGAQSGAFVAVPEPFAFSLIAFATAALTALSMRTRSDFPPCRVRRMR
jgi:hypothetical protein